MFIDTATANSRSSRPQITISPRNSSRTSPYNESQTPLLETFVGQDAPPTYLEATTPGLYSSRLSNDQGARLLSSGEREERDAAIKEEQYRKKTSRDQCTPRRTMKAVVAVVAVILLGVLLTALAAAASVRSEKQAATTTNPAVPGLSSTHDMLSPGNLKNPSDADKTNADKANTAPTEEDLKTHPDGFIGGDDDEKPHLIAVPWPTPSPSVQAPSPTESRQVFPIRWPASCGKDYSVKVEEYDFGSPKELNIQEAVHQLDGAYKRVDGWIHVVQAPASQAPGTVQARFSYAVSPEVSEDRVKYTKTANGLTIGDPTFPDGFDGVHKGKSCMGLSIVLYMGKEVAIETLNIAATHLGMQIHDGANLVVTKSAQISLTKGTLNAANFYSRATYLKTISGSISGKYSLFELLSVQSKSGSVNINVEPTEAIQGGSKSAVFMIDALSSSIRTDFKRKHIPDRDYQVYINTTVGSVDGTFIHGSRTEINSIAGLVTADLLPYKSGDYQSSIATSTHSGQTVLTLRSPYHAKNVPMTGLNSMHKSTSGALNITYPAEWMGHVDGTSMSGALHLQGQELELLGENTEPGKNHVEAKKGNGGSKMEFYTVNGGCDIEIGKI